MASQGDPRSQAQAPRPEEGAGETPTLALEGKRPRPQRRGAQEGGGGEEEGGGEGPPGRPRGKKPYLRHPKPPYSYLALIALVIQASPQKRLKLAQILAEIQRLFPLLSGGYQGWRDSVRHNLSANRCFLKEERANGKGKRNFWRVDVAQIPPALLKRQNSRRPRQECCPSFVPDLAPFVLRGEPYPPPSLPRKDPQEGPAPESPERRRRRSRDPPRKGSSFLIADLMPELARGAPLEKEESDGPGADQGGRALGPSSHPHPCYPSAPCFPTPPYCFQTPRMPWGHPLAFYGGGLAPQGAAPFSLPRPCFCLPTPASSMWTPTACTCPSLVPFPPSPVVCLGHPLGMGASVPLASPHLAATPPHQCQADPPF